MSTKWGDGNGVVVVPEVYTSVKAHLSVHLKVDALSCMYVHKLYIYSVNLKHADS